MSNPNTSTQQKPVWQPLPKLQPIEIHSLGFQKSSLEEHKATFFEAWAPDKNQLLGSNQNQLLGLTKSSPELGLENPPSMIAPSDVGLQANESFQNIDKTYIESLKNEAFQNGFLEGKRIQKEEFEKAEQVQLTSELEAEAEKAEKFNLHITSLLTEISKCASELIQKPDQLHEPLKRLALHLAEQLTLAELSLSANSIQSLIERSIETLDLASSASLTIELNPADMALLQNHTRITAQEKPLWRLVMDAHLLPGSVRVRADDSVVTDFVENRLESLAQSLLIEPSRWQSQSAFQPSRLSARKNSTSHIEDALPRTSQSLDQASNDLSKDQQVFDDSMNFGEKPEDHDD